MRLCHVMVKGLFLLSSDVKENNLGEISNWDAGCGLCVSPDKTDLNLGAYLVLRSLESKNNISIRYPKILRLFKLGDSEEKFDDDFSPTSYINLWSLIIKNTFLQWKCKKSF